MSDAILFVQMKLQKLCGYEINVCVGAVIKCSSGAIRKVVNICLNNGLVLEAVANFEFNVTCGVIKVGWKSK